jgi:UDP-N-acetylglucosamine 2-epimerase
MRVLLVGNGEGAAALAAGLDDRDIVIERRPDDPEPASGPDEIGTIARELREFEQALTDGGPDAVLVSSDSSAALAAVLVATKVRTPVAAIERAGREPAGVNGRLIRQLSDLRLAPEPAAISSWLRDTYTERP